MSRVVVIAGLTGLLVAIMGPLTTYAATSVPPGYEDVVRRIPADHWRYVNGVTLVPRRNHGATYHDRRIEVPADPDDRIMAHEIGHVVGIVRPDLVVAHWRHFVHRKNDINESFAEGYRAHVEGRTRGDEAQWWRDLVFGQPLDSGERRAPDDERIVTPKPSGCIRPDVPSGSIVPGCRG